MSAPAAFKAAYADLKFIKTRKVAQIVLELPIEEASRFVEAFGAPDPSKETWCAIARLDAAKIASPAPQKEKRSLSELPLSQQAALKCNDVSFRTFLARGCPEVKTFSLDMAVESVRSICGVKSRSELDTNPEAAAAWKRLTDEFWGWERGLA
jgi:hypothetical protein